MPNMSYPTPDAAGAPAPEDKGPEGSPQDTTNPVIGALKTIQTWIASVKEKDPQSAQSLITAFGSFLQQLQAAGGTSGPEAPPSPAPGGDQGPSPMKPASRAMEMNARPGAVPIM